MDRGGWWTTVHGVAKSFRYIAKSVIQMIYILNIYYFSDYVSLLVIIGVGEDF